MPFFLLSISLKTINKDDSLRIFENLIIDKTNLKVINSENCTFVPLQLNDYTNLNLETFGSLLKKQVEATLMRME